MTATAAVWKRYVFRCCVVGLDDRAGVIDEYARNDFVEMN